MDRGGKAVGTMPTFKPSSQSDETVLALTPRATSMSSAQIRQAWGAKVKDAALFSARTTVETYLKTLRGVIGEVAGGSVTPQVAETKLRKALHALGYSPEAGFEGHGGEVPPATPGSITDLSSSRRIELILDTNVKQARSLAQIASSSDPMAAYMRPAWKLTRTGKRKKPRGDWKRRWAAAGAACGWKGAAKGVFVALKDSPIWAEIGKGVGGFGDVIGTAYPPFAFGSGMAWVNVGRREWNEICRREGIDSGDGERLAAARTALRHEVSGDAAGAHGTQETAAGGRTGEDAGAQSYAVALPPAKPDERARKAASAKVAECVKTVARMADKAKSAVDGIRADAGRCRELSCGDEEDRKLVESAERRLKAAVEAAGNVAAALARLERYAGAVAGAPAPTDPAMQRAFDAAMGRYAEAAAKTVEEAHSQSVRVGMAASAVRKTAAMMTFTPDLSARTAAEGRCKAAAAKAAELLGKAKACAKSLRDEYDREKGRLAALFSEVPTAELDELYAAMAKEADNLKYNAIAAVRVMDYHLSRLAGLAVPKTKPEQKAFDAECAAADRGAASAEVEANQTGGDLETLRGRKHEIAEMAGRLVERWKAEECAKAADAAQGMADGAEARFEELRGRVNAAKAEMRKVRGPAKGAEKAKEERTLAVTWTYMFDARSYVRKCLKETLAAKDAGDVKEARERLAEMEAKRIPYFAKKEKALVAALDAFEAWVGAKAGADGDGAKPAREEKPAQGATETKFPATLTKRDIAESKGGIGGTTGARLFTDADGRRFILKQTNSDRTGDGLITAGHLRNEIATDRIYRAAGIKVPECREYEVDGKPVKLAAFVPDARPLGEWMRTATPAQRDKVRAKLAKGYLVDAVLANWDVAGQGLDNILVDRDGEPWRIDNGSGMGYRARGIPKKDSEWRDSQFPDEWRTLKDSNAYAFGKMTAHDIFSQEVDWDAVIAATPEADRPVVERRVKEVRQMQSRCRNFDAGKFTPEATSEVLERSYDACREGLRETVPQTKIDYGNVALMRPDAKRRLAAAKASWDPYRIADIVIAAAKTVNYHAPKHEMPNQGKIDAANALKTELMALAKTDANAKYYLDVLDRIGKSSADSFHDTVGMVERRPIAPPPNYRPPPVPAVSATEKVIDIVDRQTGGNYSFVSTWCSAQARDSWTKEACKAKIFEFEMRGKDPDPYTGTEDSKRRLVGRNGELYGFWKDGSDVRIRNYKKVWDRYKAHPKEMERDRAAFRAYKACTQVIIENTDFAGKDEATGTVVLGRTEKKEVMDMNGLSEGRFGTMVRSGAESHSIFRTVCIDKAHELTIVRVPYSRISGVYFLDRDKNGISLFLGDRENEFNVDICNGELEVYYAGKVNAGEELKPYVEKFLAAEKARNGGK